ncbi:MAG: ribose-phosphate pyrophosphokinase [Bacillales bacterium]|nr:ribose-phosphate pyrophosphokinase [Bacillales bacterium]
MYEKSIIFSLTANVELTDRIAQESGIVKGESIVKHFADGEIIVHFTTTVRGKQVYIIQSTCIPNVTEKLMELLVFIDALKRASAREIVAVIPYYGYSRQDRKSRPHEPITARLVADMLQIAGVDRIIVFDLHAPQIQGFFKCPLDDISAVPMFSKYFRKVMSGNNDLVIVSPDHGGVTRARKLASGFGSKEPQIAIIDKRRSKPNESEVMNIIGDVRGKTCIIIDDIIDTAKTLCNAAKSLIDAGAIAVYAAATHPILSDNAVARIEKSVIKEVVVTDTIPIPSSIKSKKLIVLSVQHLIKGAIEKIEESSSLSVIYEDYDAKDK